ncbi:Hypothetical predicted protein [Mytilus galloprovincialis]|uniref:Reverse transcriptase/retrotransposon-derived protein RNase H-like domain-containing protein n=1 Tax=Mytilus galloprovincialis TaxID=29158 RepID=A0A8B6CG57_MYTGA|nr:Hypothetical predicted protein [Mytilus galloprovincialis]
MASSKKGKEFKWESEHQDAFNSIKKALTTPPVLGYPDPNFPFILDTDASENTIGAELSQIQNGKCVTLRDTTLICFLVEAVSTALEQGNQWQIFEEDVDFVVPLTARSVSCTSPVGIIGLTIRSIRNVTSDNNICIMGMPTSYSNDDLRQLQNQDKHLSTIIAWLTLNYTPSKQELQMQSPTVRHLWQYRFSRTIGVCPKLKSPWKGPFVVAEVKSPVLYKIRNKKTSEVVHHDRLKLSQIRDLPIWTQRLKKRILANLERKKLEDLTDKEEHCDLGLDWLFSNNEQMSGNMMDSILAQSDSLTVGSNTEIGQSDFLTNKRSSQEAEQFTLQGWETLMNLDDNFGDQTIIYNIADTVEAQVKLSGRDRGRDRKAPAHLKDNNGLMVM